MNSRKVLKKWNLGFIQTRRRFSATRAPSTRTRKKQLEVDDMKIEILTRTESVKYLGQKILFYQQETTGNQEPYQGCMGDIPQVQTRVDIEKLHAQTPSRATRRRSISDCLLRRGNVGTQQRTRKNDSIDATRDATTHHPNKREIQKRLRNQEIGTCSIDDESGDSQSRTTHNDVDSEVSFEDDVDDEIDTTLIEEERLD